jgi:NMD protein affecting ribosome stability and mRNA decay
MTDKDKVQPLRAGNVVQQADHQFNRYSCFVPASTTVEDLENHQFWVHYARSILPGAEIRALAEDHSFVAYLLVLSKSGNNLKVRCINFKEFERVEESLDQKHEGFEIKHVGGGNWNAINTTTGERVFPDNSDSQAKAAARLDEHMRALNS